MNSPQRVQGGLRICWRRTFWVVWALAALFESELGERLVFKGGTSLSKGYKVIRRFSEDIDLTYDIRAIAPDLVGEAAEALPADRAEERRWTKEIRKRLPAWVSAAPLPLIQRRLAEHGSPAAARAEGDKIFISYEPLAIGSGYVRPEVLLEFGARSTGEPSDVRLVESDAAQWIDALIFPSAHPRVMRAERTFWEKATATHVFCRQQRLRGERFARHWHDLARLDDAGIAAAAIADREIAAAVARHKSMFFPENDIDRQAIDYHAAVSGAMRLVPDGAALQALREDYDAMVEDGLLLEDAEPFETLMERCGGIEARANGYQDQGHLARSGERL